MYNPVYGSASKNEEENVIFFAYNGTFKRRISLPILAFCPHANQVLGHRTFFCCFFYILQSVLFCFF